MGFFQTMTAHIVFFAHINDQLRSYNCLIGVLALKSNHLPLLTQKLIREDNDEEVLPVKLNPNSWFKMIMGILSARKLKESKIDFSYFIHNIHY